MSEDSMWRVLCNFFFKTKQGLKLRRATAEDTQDKYYYILQSNKEPYILTS